MQSEIHSLNDKIMIPRYIIGVGFGVIALLITVFKFLGWIYRRKINENLKRVVRSIKTI